MPAIGIGAWLGTIMLFNVWVLIWPNQQKILGMKPATDEEKNKARRVAFLASRTNMMLSIPMLFFMAGGLSHRRPSGCSGGTADGARSAPARGARRRHRASGQSP